MIFLHLLGKYMQHIPQLWDQVSINDWLPKLKSRDVAGLSSVFKREIWAKNPEIKEGTKLQGSLPILCIPLLRTFYLAEVTMN